MRTFGTLVCVSVCVGLGGCGQIGEPLYPALKVPARITDLTAVERGDEIAVHFTTPLLTTEGLVLREIGSVDLRVGQSTSTPFNMNQWADNATQIQVPTPDKPGPVMADVQASQFIGKEVLVSVRLANANGRYSEWSNFAPLKVEQPLAKPRDFKVEASAEGVSLTWNAPDAHQFRVYRKAEPDGMTSLLATVTEPMYMDTTAVYGMTYDYYVQSAHDKTESDVAGPETITPKDIFPPHVPTGLTASAGLGTIELAWDRNTEPDFKEYRVFRSEEGGPFVQVAAGLEAPSYSDHDVASGKHYRYQVEAVDQIGNVSQPCAPVEAIAP